MTKCEVCDKQLDSFIPLCNSCAHRPREKFKFNIPDSVAMRCPMCVKPMKLEATGYNSAGTHNRFCMCCDACRATVVMDVYRGLSALVPPNPERSGADASQATDKAEDIIRRSAESRCSAAGVVGENK